MKTEADVLSINLMQWNGKYFAIESLLNERRKSSPALEHLIFGSKDDIYIREVTEEEQSSLDQFKRQQKCKHF